MEVKHAVVVPIDVELTLMLSRFILNANIFTPEERHTLIKLFEYLIIPKYPPVEKEYHRTNDKRN
jgi:hypothetical protein